jgi:hypothetical protein
MKKARNNVLEGGITMVSQAEYIYAYLSENMFVPTVMFWVAIAIAITSVVCFILAPLYSKGKHGGVKVLAQIITILDFIGGIGCILVFAGVSVLSLLSADGAFADASLPVQEKILGILLAPTRFGMSLDSFVSGDLSAGTVILFYGLYFGVSGLLGIITFIVNSSARGKYNGINGKIRGAAAPQGVPGYNPYQPYGQNGQNIPQGYPQQYQQNVQQGYPQQYQQNVQQGYPQQYQHNVSQSYPQQYQQNVSQSYPQQYQHNSQYQSNSGEPTMLTPEMSEQPVAAVPVMNAQPAPGYAEPVPEPTEPTVPETIQPEAPTEPVSEVTQPEAPTESVSEVTQPEVPTESVSEVTQPEAPTEPVSEVTQPEVATEPVSEVVQPEASAQSAAASFCENCGNALVQDAIFCPNCGHRVNTAPTAVCTGCGAKLPDGAAFCTACGKRSGT